MRMERATPGQNRDVAVPRLLFVHLRAVEVDLARRDPFQAGDHAQQGGLATARRAGKDKELSVRDVDVHTMEDCGLGMGFAQRVEGCDCHPFLAVDRAADKELLDPDDVHHRGIIARIEVDMVTGRSAAAWPAATRPK